MALPFTHVVARPDGFVVTATQVFHASKQPVVDAARWAQANTVSEPLFIGVQGAHPSGFSVCDDPKKASTIVAPKGAPLRPMIFVGVDPDALIGSVTFWKKGGNPGPCEFRDLTMQASSLAKFCILTAQTNLFDRLDLVVRRVRFVASWPNTVLNAIKVAYRKSLGRFFSWVVGDGPPDLGALSAVRTHGAVKSFEAEDCNADGFGEHPFYCGNTIEYERVHGCTLTDCGRTGGQHVNREWEEKERINKTGCPSSPETCEVSYIDNWIIDCASYFDPKAKGSWMANGGGLTSAGNPGRTVFARNRIVQSHPGGGGITIYGDRPKIGSYLTHDGFAHGDVIVEDNEVRCMVGASAAREAISIDDCRSLTWRANKLTGSEKRITVGPRIGKVVDLDGTLP